MSDDAAMRSLGLATQMFNSGLLPSFFSLDVGSFYMQLASELDRRRVLQIVRENLHPPRRVFVGVIDPINPKVETPQEVRDRVLEASEFIPMIQLGTVLVQISKKVGARTRAP